MSLLWLAEKVGTAPSFPFYNEAFSSGQFQIQVVDPHRTTSNSETCSPLPELINLLSSLCFEDKRPLNWVTLCYQRRLSPSSKMAGLELAVCWLHSFIVLCCQAGHRVESSRNGGGKEMKAIRTGGKREMKTKTKNCEPLRTIRLW